MSEMMVLCKAQSKVQRPGHPFSLGFVSAASHCCCIKSSRLYSLCVVHDSLSFSLPHILSPLQPMPLHRLLCRRAGVDCPDTQSSLVYSKHLKSAIVQDSSQESGSEASPVCAIFKQTNKQKMPISCISQLHDFISSLIFNEM